MNAKPKTELNSFVFIQKRCNVKADIGRHWCHCAQQEGLKCNSENFLTYSGGTVNCNLKKLFYNSDPELLQKQQENNREIKGEQ